MTPIRTFEVVRPLGGRTSINGGVGINIFLGILERALQAPLFTRLFARDNHRLPFFHYIFGFVWKNGVLKDLWKARSVSERA